MAIEDKAINEDLAMLRFTLATPIRLFKRFYPANPWSIVVSASRTCALFRALKPSVNLKGHANT